MREPSAETRADGRAGEDRDRRPCGLYTAVVHDRRAGRWLLFRDPLEVLSACDIGSVRDLLRRVERAVEHGGLHAAGFVAYEAAPAFDPALRTRPPDGRLPLAWFGLYRAPTPLDALPAARTMPGLADWRPTIARSDYARAIARIKGWIERGDTYQVNFTYRLRAAFSGDTWALFARLAGAQGAAYGACLDLGDHALCSASPELFFRLDGDLLTCKPMKGTAARHPLRRGDEAQAEWLRHSEKNRAENLMIVDMVRHDIGRVARVGTVTVPALFEAERYPTLWQMTSTVSGRTDAPWADIVAALFPAASVTGAPKCRTMQIIAELETTPRGVYTGGIGFLSPGRRAQFNVAIRTAVIDRRKGAAEYGTGSGVVWDSDETAEFDECRTKAAILASAPDDFSLLETLRWTPDSGYGLLDRHLSRLSDSAAWFDRRIDLAGLRAELDRRARAFPSGPCRVRLLVPPDGAPAIEAAPLPSPAEVVTLGLARTPISPDDVFLYHKTTRRDVYERARAERPDCEDTLLWNRDGEVTESTIGNVVCELDGSLVTPPVHCGLLPGTQRAELIESGRVRERAIRISDLPRCTRVLVVNSVRGLREARLVV